MRGVEVKVFIVCLLALGSLRERASRPPLVHPSGETATRESCEAALAFMAEQGEWSGPPLNARRGGLRRAATVTLRKEQMKTAAKAPRLHERHRARSRRRASGRGVGRTTAAPMRDGLPGVDLRLRDRRPEAGSWHVGLSQARQFVAKRGGHSFGEGQGIALTAPSRRARRHPYTTRLPRQPG